MNSNFPSVSVVIPVKNEGLKIKACLDGILSQTVPVKEIIVVDSGSTDNTLHILQQYPQVTLVQIPSTEFNHGLTRNVGVSKATTDFVLLTVGDAQPGSERWIEELLKGFDAADVAGVCGLQTVPHDKDKNPLDWYRPQSVPARVKYQFKSGDFEKLSPREKKNACAWDDVTAMYRREVLVKIPFQKTTFSEDAIWAKEVLARGYAIVYNAAARVYHYHIENADFTFRRSFTVMYFQFRHFGFLPERPVMSRLRIVKSLFTSLRADIGGIIRWYNYNTRNFEATRKSYELFMKMMKEGEATLDLRHEELCGKPPVPLKIEITANS